MMMMNIVSFILLLVVWPVDVVVTIDAFSIDTNVMVLLHTNHFHPMTFEGSKHHHHHYHHLQSNSPQPRNENVMIRSALAYGRSDNDDDEHSEWYHPPPSKHTVTTEIDNEDDDTTSVPSASLLESDGIQSQYRHYGMYTVQYTTITSAQQFNDLLDISSSSSLLPDMSTPPSTNNNDIRDDTNHELIIVKFYASWCKSCQKIGYKMDQLISELSSTSGGSTSTTKSSTTMNHPPTTTTTTTSTRRWIHVVQVDYSTITNRELFVQYNITQLPTIHLYTKQRRNDDDDDDDDDMTVVVKKVMDLPCPPHQFHKVRNWVLSYYKNMNQTNPERSDKEGASSISTKTRSVFDFGHDIIESSVLPILRATTKKNEKIM